jgi:threonine synthase
MKIYAAQESMGQIGKVTDEDILKAYKLVARTEGVFVEPACATPLAGLIKSVQEGLVEEGSLVVATMTGHGLKDPDTAISTAGFEPVVVNPNREDVMRVIGL